MARKKAESLALERERKNTYDEFKQFEGKRYTGVRLGRGHEWNYDPGIWKETASSARE